MSDDKQPLSPAERTRWVVTSGIVLLFVGSILWSMWAETVLPLLRAGDTRGLLLHAVGLPLILLGTGLFVWGGFVFTRDTFSAFRTDEEVLMHKYRAQEARRRNEMPPPPRPPVEEPAIRILLRAWRPGAALLASGFALIALGGFLINL